MTFPFFRRRASERTIGVLYGTIVTQARQPVFYADYGVPDTPEGRFEMIVLHLAPVLRRFRDASSDIQAGAQALFDRFCADMDGNLREMGLSDVGVPRTMRRLGEAFYGRAAAYERAFDETDQDVQVEALARNVYGDPAILPAGATRLADYVRRLTERLAEQAPDALMRGEISFPPAIELTETGLGVARTEAQS